MKSSGDLDNHELKSNEREANQKKFRCFYENCNQSYTKLSNLTQHQRKHTNEKPFKCDKIGCEMNFFRKSHLNVHIISHLSEEEKPFHCKYCNKGVNTNQHLKRHEKTHQKSFLCSYDGCDESFYKHQTLRHHILTYHEKTLTCVFCNKTFSRPYRLANHKLKCHNESFTYHCDSLGCFLNFKTWSSLQNHKKKDHQKLICDLCGKGCVGQKGLDSHLIVHDENKSLKLWECTYCQNTKYLKKLDLINHFNEKHKDIACKFILDSENSISCENEFEKNIMNPIIQDYIEGRNSLKNDNNFKKLYKKKNIDINTQKKKLKNLLNSFGNKLTILDLILNNYKSKLTCSKENCNRTFTTKQGLTKHLNWHESKHNLMNQNVKKSF